MVAKLLPAQESTAFLNLLTRRYHTLFSNQLVDNNYQQSVEAYLKLTISTRANTQTNQGATIVLSTNQAKAYVVISVRGEQNNSQARASVSLLIREAHTLPRTHQ